MANKINKLIPYSYTVKENEFLHSLIPWKIEYWNKKKQTKTMKEFKENIKNDMLVKQGYRCYYCEKRFYCEVGNPEREHFADKDKYSEYMFLPENLVLACHTCNEFVNGKGTYDSVFRPHLPYYLYQENTFKLPHPYFDNKSDHIEYDGEKWIVKNGSSKGDQMWKLFPSLSTALLKKQIKDNPLISGSDEDLLLKRILDHP